MLERNVDQGIVRWAKERWPKMIVRKLTTMKGRGMVGDPDRLFFWDKKLMLIEMKAPGGECTEAQLARQAEWRAAGATVLVVEDVSAGRMALNQFFAGKKRTSLRSIV